MPRVTEYGEIMLNGIDEWGRHKIDGFLDDGIFVTPLLVISDLISIEESISKVFEVFDSFSPTEIFSRRLPIFDSFTLAELVGRGFINCESLSLTEEIKSGVKITEPFSPAELFGKQFQVSDSLSPTEAIKSQHQIIDSIPTLEEPSLYETEPYETVTTETIATDQISLSEILGKTFPIRETISPTETVTRQYEQYREVYESFTLEEQAQTFIPEKYLQIYDTFNLSEILRQKIFSIKEISSLIEIATRTPIPPIPETIIAKHYPMLYQAKPLKSAELTSKVEAGTPIAHVAKHHPELLTKRLKTKELRSKII